MNEVGAIGYMHGHNHFIQAYKDANSGRLVFSSASAVFNAEYGVMYFDVYKDSIVCFWQPTKGDARPLGVFNLKEVAKGGKNIINANPHVSQLKPREVTIKWQTNSTLRTSLNFRKNEEMKNEDKRWINQPVAIEPIWHKM